jgi:hypothetical protein
MKQVDKITVQKLHDMSSESYKVDRKKWDKMSFFSQMGNIGSEVGRTAKEFKKGNDLSFNAALERALDLFNATTENLISTRSIRAKEVLRSRDQFVTQFYGDKKKVDPNLEAYFMNFAIAERLNR